NRWAVISAWPRMEFAREGLCSAPLPLTLIAVRLDCALCRAERSPDSLVYRCFDWHCRIVCRRLHREPVFTAACRIALPPCWLLHVDHRRNYFDASGEVRRALIEPPRVFRRLFLLSHAAIAGWSSVA